MKTVVRSARIHVNAQLQTTFDYVSDLTKHPEWSGGELKIEAVTSDPIAVGKEYLSKGEVAIQKDRPNTVTVTKFEPPHTLAPGAHLHRAQVPVSAGEFGFVANDPDFGDVAHVFTFAEQSGGVLVTRTMTLTLNPVIAFLFKFFIYPFIGKPATVKSLAALKTKLER
jgi:uncharacterized protein YndB with AHSA1/START domain